ncbi:hypothetical protein O0L34_g3031 [Tuta absoluta]|nr:hypothetical protein O0L34_g3031 [Tuta absoluta]
MPVERSPPRTDTQPAASAAMTNQVLVLETDSPNVTGRSHDRQSRSDLNNLREDLHELMERQTIRLNAQFESLKLAVIEEVATRTKGILDSIEFVSKQYDDMKAKLFELENRSKEDRAYILKLEDRVEFMERSFASTKIEIRNIPKTEGESKEDLTKLIMKTASVLNVPLQQQEIKNVFRQKAKSNKPNQKEVKSPTIIVDFQRSDIKEQIISKVRRFNQQNKSNKFNTGHLKCSGPKTPVYFAENLTPKMQHLHYLARKFKEEKGFKYCWTSFGRVYLRRGDGQPHITINREEDLANISQQI